MGLAVSTSWNAFRHTGALSIVSEIAALDFHAIELSFNLPFEVVEGIAGLVERNKIQVVSLHNFCPIPDDIPRERALPDCFSMASASPEERARAVLQTKKTVDTAASVNAAAVVLHTGRVNIPDRTRELIEMYDRGLKDTDAFRAARQSVIDQRNQSCHPYLENALASLEELDRYAQKKGVMLGVETRFYYREIPNLEEIGVVLKRFAGSSIRYWHDVGHAQLMENLGFCRHEDFLEAGKGSLIGVHLHNIIGTSDHQPPSKGEFDFKRLLPYVTKETIKVIEAHHPATADDLLQSKRMLEELFRGKI